MSWWSCLDAVDSWASTKSKVIIVDSNIMFFFFSTRDHYTELYALSQTGSLSIAAITTKYFECLRSTDAPEHTPGAQIMEGFWIINLAFFFLFLCVNFRSSCIVSLFLHYVSYSTSGNYWLACHDRIQQHLRGLVGNELFTRLQPQTKCRAPLTAL